MRLPQVAVSVLLKGRYANAGGKTPRARGQNLLQIAALYSREELLAERGVGPRTVDIIERWLIAQGLNLRRTDDEREVGADCLDNRF